MKKYLIGSTWKAVEKLGPKYRKFIVQFSKVVGSGDGRKFEQWWLTISDERFVGVTDSDADIIYSDWFPTRAGAIKEARSCMLTPDKTVFEEIHVDQNVLECS